MNTLTTIIDIEHQCCLNTGWTHTKLIRTILPNPVPEVVTGSLVGQKMPFMRCSLLQDVVDTEKRFMWNKEAARPDFL